MSPLIERIGLKVIFSNTVLPWPRSWRML